MPFRGRHRKDERPGVADPLIPKEHRVIRIALGLRLLDGNQLILIGIEKLERLVLLETLVHHRVGVGKAQQEPFGQHPAEPPTGRRQEVGLAARRRPQDRQENGRHLEEPARDREMALRTRQSMTGEALRVDCRPLKIEAAGQKPLGIIRSQTRITEQVGVLGDPEVLLRRECGPAMWTTHPRLERYSYARTD